MKRKIKSDKDNGAEEYECNHTINILTLRYDVQVIPPRNGEENVLADCDNRLLFFIIH